MKIALLHYTSPPVVGGVESVIAHHARLMTESGHKVTIFSGRGQVFDKSISVHSYSLLDSKNEEVLNVKTMLDKGACPSEFDDLRYRIMAKLSTDLDGFDLLIAHNIASMNKNLPLTAAIQSIHSRRESPRLILWHHDIAWTSSRYQPELHPGYPWDLLRTRWPKTLNVVVSQVRRKQFAHLVSIPPEEIRVIPNGVDANEFFKFEPGTIRLVRQLNLSAADPLLLLPARLTPRKNIELAIKVLAELHADFPDAKLLVTGPEGPHNPANVLYKQKLLDLRDEMHLQDAVIFLAELSSKFIDDDVISDFYRLADAMFFPSLEEGFGIPLIEAAFSSKPVFCADIPVLRELGGDDVDYFDPHTDPSAIACQIKTRLENEMTSRWSRRAKQKYSWETIYKTHIEKLLEEVMQ